jgi:hypothetical protein
MYRTSAKNLANKIMVAEAAKEFERSGMLRHTFAQVEREIVRLNKKTGSIIEKMRNNTARLSLRGQIDALALGSAGFPKSYKVRLDSKKFSQIWHRTVRALSVPIDGIELSERVWDIHRTTLTRMNRYLGRSFAEGKPMSKMRQEIKKFLIFPDADMRKKEWKQFFAENPPGRGVYRSAYKNAERVMRTETNRAFRESAAQYGMGKNWVAGIQWVRADWEPCPICDELASIDYYGLGPGVYPPEAFPTHSHPHCICYSVTIPRSELILPDEAVVIPMPLAAAHLRDDEESALVG